MAPHTFRKSVLGHNANDTTGRNRCGGRDGTVAQKNVISNDASADEAIMVGQNHMEISPAPIFESFFLNIVSAILCMKLVF
jgi:hypothetical protein